MEIREYIVEYNTLTLSMIRTLEEEDYDVFIELLSKRGVVLEDIEKSDLKLSDFMDEKESNIMFQQEKNLKEVLNSKKEELREKITLLDKGNQARVNYNKPFYDSTKIFSKKV